MATDGTIATTVNQIIRTFNLQNVRTINANKPNQYDGKIDQTTEKDRVLYKSSLGTPVFTDLTFDPIRYELGDGTIRRVPQITMQTVLMTVSQSKNIVLTQIQGRDGTVKEYIGMGDYDVTINGIITGANQHYPIDEVYALKQMLDAPVPLVAVSWYLQNLDIYNLVVKDYAFDQEPGGYSKQMFTINCYSDTPIELLITNI